MIWFFYSMASKIPVHIVIIPDGNRRWAKENGLGMLKGVEKSAELDNIVSLLDGASRLGIKFLSMWGFSTENWSRSKTERDFIFELVFKSIENLKVYAKKKKIKFRHIGRKDRLPKKVIMALEEFEQNTAENKGLNVQFLLDYGGRDEIVRAVNKIIQKGEKEIDEETFKEYLDTNEIPDPDLIIRTGGERRLSGLMSYQNAYSELYFTDIYFPDFDADELKKAVNWFNGVERKFGGD